MRLFTKLDVKQIFSKAKSECWYSGNSSFDFDENSLTSVQVSPKSDERPQFPKKKIIFLTVGKVNVLY